MQSSHTFILCKADFETMLKITRKVPQLDYAPTRRYFEIKLSDCELTFIEAV